MVQLAYQSDSEKSQFILMREVSEFGDSTCLQIAYIANDQKFLAHNCVQELLVKLWYDKLSSDTSLSKVYYIFKANYFEIILIFN
jgi:hypothetical protein